MVKMEREVVRLFKSFPNGYINFRWEFVVGANEDVSIPLEHISDKWDSAKLLLMFASSEACDGRPYWDFIRNSLYRQRLRDGINEFCRTRFSRRDFQLIALAIGDCHNMALAEKFVKNGCKLSILRRAVSQDELAELEEGGEHGHHLLDF